MKQIRQAAFETNSSSMHSMTIAPGEFIPDRMYVVDGVCEVHPGEFGWGYDRATDAATKASYCLTWLRDKMDTDTLAAMLIEVIKEGTGATVVKFVPEAGDFYEWGYIDHQSADVAAEAFESADTLRRFIFNPASVLVIDNDNSPHDRPAEWAIDPWRA